MRSSRAQTSFEFKTWGGARRGAGRKRSPANVGLQKHVARDELVSRHPVHVTMRAASGTPAMRRQVLARIVVGEVARASAKGLRVLHYSIQNDHLHLVCEADSGAALSRGMQRLASRIALGANLAAGRRGRFWRDRYHRRDLTSPRQVRNAIVYVAVNARKHREGGETLLGLDVLSSAIWTDDWADRGFARALAAERPARASPIASAKTWLGRVGWKRHGLLRM